MAPDLDAIDRRLLGLLQENSRRTLRDLAARVGLTVAPVQRRITRLEDLGVIAGYTIKINHAAIAAGLEAVTELRVAGDLDLEQIKVLAMELPEVVEVLTITGDLDALVRVRVDGVQHLQSVVNRLRSGGRVTGTRTMVVLESWSR